VGAGDSFLAGLLWALDAGTGLEEALATAVAAGTAAVMATGTTLCQREEVMHLRQKVQVRAA
jgi:6-phosphofructokinase 2